METASFRITVLFENPFWIALIERQEEGRYAVCKVTFGAEPKDYEVYEFLLQNWRKLSFSPFIRAEKVQEVRINPKRQQRIVKRQLEENRGIGTKAQQALQLQREEGKLERKTRSKAEKEQEEERRFALRQEKKKEKHRGH